MSINGNLTYWSNYSNWPIIHLPEKTGIGYKIMIRLIASFFFLFFQIQLINFDRDRKNLKNFFNEINYSKEGKVYLEKLHYIVQYLETIFFYCEKSNNTCWHLYIYIFNRDIVFFENDHFICSNVSIASCWMKNRSFERG